MSKEKKLHIIWLICLIIICGILTIFITHNCANGIYDILTDKMDEVEKEKNINSLLLEFPTGITECISVGNGWYEFKYKNKIFLYRANPNNAHGHSAMVRLD